MNRLQFENSPYLLQHAANPVDWYPWAEESFEMARQEDKPVFLSIGYSTCHWCHVMEHESFEDYQIAALMNETFISIKVDREERPDIDNIYMSVCQMTTGSGGWPLTIIMTPDKKPFFAATYIPKENRFNRPGLLTIIPQIKKLWDLKRGEVLNSAKQITDYLQKYSHSQFSGQSELGPDKIIDKAYLRLESSFDKIYGGFGSAPKFPTAHKIIFLLRYWQRTKSEAALQMAETTLKTIRKGGIYDHIGFGFHRYSTDRYWLLPHFEKMLYDQAMLAMAYTEAFLATAKSEYKNTTCEILDYVLRDMTAPEGGFYSAEDADSEGKEGLFYLWSIEDIRRILDKDSADLILKLYNLSEQGNYAGEASAKISGLNILYNNKSIQELATELKMSEAELSRSLDTSRERLFEERKKRIHPFKDDKILTDWNGLMIATLAKASQAFENPVYMNAAKKGVCFILNNLRHKNGGLMHRYRNGQAGLPASVDDYAFFIWGLLELYETTFNINYFSTALELNKNLIQNYWDDKNGGFFFSADDSENLLVRKKEFFDGALPSGNSVSMMNMVRLARMTGNAELEQKAYKIAESSLKEMSQAPDNYIQLITALDFGFGSGYEIVIAGDQNSADTISMLKALRQNYIPNKVVMLRPTNGELPVVIDYAKNTKLMKCLDGKATAYVCQNYKCQKPVTDVEKMLALLRVKKRAST